MVGAIVLLVAIAVGVGWWWKLNQGPTDEELSVLFQEEGESEDVKVSDNGNYLHEAPADFPESTEGSEVVEGTIIPNSEVEVINQNTSMTEVSISELGFTPEEVTVAQGEKVKFVNNGQGMHEPMQTDLDGFVAGIMQTGDSYTFTWEMSGEWLVTDKYNDEAKLRVVVE